MSALTLGELQAIEAFLEERYREEESWAHRWRRWELAEADAGRITVRQWLPGDPFPYCGDTGRILAEVTAKRAAVKSLVEAAVIYNKSFARALQPFLAVYAAHPQYREEWNS